MALKTEIWRIEDYLDTPDDIFYYLETKLEDAEPPYGAKALDVVARVRGGVDQLSAETGVPADVLRQSIATPDVFDRDTLTRIMEAYRPAAERTPIKVA